MSNQLHHKLRYTRYFMAPVWIALALGGMGVAFLLGGALVTDEWSRQDNEKLAAYKPGSLFIGPASVAGDQSLTAGAGEPIINTKGSEPGSPGTTETEPPKPASLSDLVWRSPASALEWAAEGVKHDRIEFAIYRNLLRAALADQSSSARSIAFRSIRDVLQDGGGFADDLRAELQSMAPQIFLVTSSNEAGKHAGDTLADELRSAGMAIAGRETLDPAQINDSKVACYSADTCKDAKALLPLLRSEGYTIADADMSSRAEDDTVDKARALYGAKMIRIVLSDPKLVQSAAATPVKAPSTPPRPKKSAHRAVKQRVQTANRPVQTANR
jgi:hypothetical protein